jgi:hypothetical protein
MYKESPQPDAENESHKETRLEESASWFVVDRNSSKEGTGIIVQPCPQLKRHHRVTSISGGGACMGIVWLQEVDGVERKGGVVDTR